MTGIERAERRFLPSSLLPSVMIGVLAGIDNIVAALAMGALMFSGPLAAGMGLGVGVILLGGALLSLIVALLSVLPNSVALVQETTIAILAAAIASMLLVSTGDVQMQTATAIAIMGASSLTTGVLFWITGRLKLGSFMHFLPYPVVAGFLAGSGWLLIDGAAIMLTGQALGLTFVQALGETEIVLRVGPAVAFALVLILTLNRFTHPLTIPLVMIGSAIAFYAVLQGTEISIETARTLGHLPQMNASGRLDIPTPALLTHVDWWAVFAAWPSLLIIAGISMIGLMLNVGGLELIIDRDIDINAELRSSGLANFVSGSAGGPSGFVGLSMTELAQKTGASGRGAGIMTAVVMLLALLATGSLVFQIPTFLTGGFVLFLGIRLLSDWLVDTRRRLPLSEWLIVAVIVLSVAFVGFMAGLAVGLMVSSAVFVFKYSRLPIIRLHATGVERRSNVDRSAEDIKYLSLHGDAIEVVQLQGYLFFGSANHVVSLIRRRLDAPDKRSVKFIVLDFRDVRGADSAAIACFVKIRRLADAHNARIFLTNVPTDLHQHLALAGLEFSGDSLMALLADLDHALEYAEEEVLSEQGRAEGGTSLLDHFVAAIGPHTRLADLIDVMTKQEMEPGEVLIKQGDDADDVFFVAAGRVRVQLRLPNGKVLRLRTMLGGAIVGEVALYLRQARTADVIVDAPSVIFRLSAEDFTRLEREDPELAALAHRLLASNLSEKLSLANKMIQLMHD